MKTKTIIKFFSELFNKNFSHAEKSAGRSNETVQEKKTEKIDGRLKPTRS